MTKLFNTDKSRNRFDPIELIAKIDSGDSRAESELVSHFAPALRLILQKRYQDEQLRQDVFQDTFRVLIESIRSKSLKNPKALSSFIQSTAINLAREYIYQEGRHRVIDEPGEIDRVISTEFNNEKRLEKEELISFVRNVTQSLETDRDRLILIRYYLEEQDKELICKELDLESAHFDRVLYRAKQRLRKLIEKSARTL